MTAGSAVSEIESQTMKTSEQEGQKETEALKRTQLGNKARFDEMVAAARVVYLWHGGRQHKEIERKMRELGWTKFHRKWLYARRLRSRVIDEGWPEKYGWKTTLLEHSLLPAVRETGREFEHWLNAVFPEWIWTWDYQIYLYSKLARVTSGRCKRLMIFMPPRHGKSEMVTFRYTAWRLLREPGLNVIIGSYNQRLANKASRRIQRIFDAEVLTAETQRHGEDGRDGTTENTESTEKPERKDAPPRLGVSAVNKLTRPARSVAEWETGGGGTVRAVGVGAGIAGFGAGLVVIDDPVRNRADAESETYRDRVSDWFNDDIYTRLEPDAAIILIQTRWHEDDLAGRLLKEVEDGGEDWDVVKLPAIAEDHLTAETQSRGEEFEQDVQDKQNVTPHSESDSSDTQRLCVSAVKKLVDPIGRKPGEALCPERYPIGALERTRKKLGSYSFAALYQQEPVPSKGVKFKREWFRKIVDEAPKGLRWKRGYDLAVSLKTSADYTASFRCAYDKAGNLYIADGYRARIEYPDQRRYIVERLQAERDTEHGVESALHGKALIQDLRSQRENRAFAFKEVTVAADKLTRALAWLNLAEAGKLFLVRGAWIDEFLDEVSRFPHGKHDDQIDAVSVAVSMLAKKENHAGGWLIA